MKEELNNPHIKEENNMPSTLPKENAVYLKSSLNKISSKLKVLEGDEKKIKLNPKKPTHKEWFNDDGVK